MQSSIRVHALHAPVLKADSAHPQVTISLLYIDTPTRASRPAGLSILYVHLSRRFEPGATLVEGSMKFSEKRCRHRLGISYVWKS